MRKLCVMILLFVSTVSAAKAQSGDYFVRPVLGISILSDTVGQSIANGEGNGNIEIDVESGFNAGLGFGYHYSDQVAIELFWEYRSNESQTTLPDATQFEEGNYASNLVFVNGHYYFESNTSWQVYLGGGLGWVQEIDIDLESNDAELSYSDSGGLAYQVFTGISYAISNHIDINAEARYLHLSSPTLQGENTNGIISDIDYHPSTLQLGLTWRF